MAFDPMSSRERRHVRNSNGIRDVGTFVENYNSLLDKLYPVFAVWDGVLYVARYTADLFSAVYGQLGIYYTGYILSPGGRTT